MRLETARRQHCEASCFKPLRIQSASPKSGVHASAQISSPPGSPPNSKSNLVHHTPDMGSLSSSKLCFRVRDWSCNQRSASAADSTKTCAGAVRNFCRRTTSPEARRQDFKTAPFNLHALTLNSKPPGANSYNLTTLLPCSTLVRFARHKHKRLPDGASFGAHSQGNCTGLDVCPEPETLNTPKHEELVPQFNRVYGVGSSLGFRVLGLNS